MSLLWTSGSNINILGRVAAAQVTCSPAIDANFPLSYLSDGDPGSVSKFGSAVANSFFTCDGDLLSGNGAFEAAFVSGAPVGFTNTSTGTGANTRTTTAGEFVSGGALKCANGASGFAQAKGLIRARPGEQLRIIGRMRGDGSGAGGNSAFAYLKNPITGSWFDGIGNVFVNAQTTLGQTNAAAYTGGNEVDEAITVESYQACAGADYVDLELYLGSNTIGNRIGYFDEWYVWPVTNFSALLGIQNLGPKQSATPSRTWEWYSDSQASFATQTLLVSVEATGPGKGIPSGYAKVSDNNRRYNRFNFPGTPSTAPSFGEAIFGYINTALRNQEYGYSVSPLKRQVENVSRGGVVRRYPYTTFPEVGLTLQFQSTSRAQMEELFHEWFLRSAGGQYPMLVVPDDSGAGLDRTVFYGRMPQSVAITRPLSSKWDWAAMALVASPLP